MLTHKWDDFISQMTKKGYEKLLNLNNKTFAPELSQLTESALKNISGGKQCEDCIYLSFSKSL